MARTQVREPPRRGHSSEHIDWSLLSPQGRVLFYIAFCPGCGIREIARALSLTERATWAIVRRLRQAGMLHVQTEGRRNSYRINLDGPLLHPTIGGFSLRDLLGPVLAGGSGRRSDQCLEVGRRPPT